MIANSLSRASFTTPAVTVRTKMTTYGPMVGTPDHAQATVPLPAIWVAVWVGGLQDPLQRSLFLAVSLMPDCECLSPVERQLDTGSPFELHTPQLPWTPLRWCEAMHETQPRHSAYYCSSYVSRRGGCGVRVREILPALTSLLRPTVYTLKRLVDRMMLWNWQ